MGISPLYWGKQGWQFIHYVALNYPDKPTDTDKEIYRKFLDSIEYILPCPFCASHFKMNMEKHPPDLSSKMAFFNWTVDMHNFVNLDNRKKTLSHQEALEELTRDPNYLSNAFKLSAALFVLILLTTGIIVKFSKK